MWLRRRAEITQRGISQRLFTRSVLKISSRFINESLLYAIVYSIPQQINEKKNRSDGPQPTIKHLCIGRGDLHKIRLRLSAAGTPY